MVIWRPMAWHAAGQGLCRGLRARSDTNATTTVRRYRIERVLWRCVKLRRYVHVGCINVFVIRIYRPYTTRHSWAFIMADLSCTVDNTDLVACAPASTTCRFTLFRSSISLSRVISALCGFSASAGSVNTLSPCDRSVVEHLRLRCNVVTWLCSHITTIA